MAPQYRRMRPSPVARRAEPQEETKQPTAPKSGGEWALGLALLAFGALAWLASAKYTLIGWVIGLNTALAWLGLPLNVPAPIGYAILLAIPLGVVYSRVETRVWQGSRNIFRAPLFWIGWIIIVATDVGSTYLGVRAPAADAWPITIQIASSAGVSFVVSLVLTFIPEWMILGARRFLR